VSSAFVSCWFETRTGTRYELPDMTTDHVDMVCRQLDGEADTITVVNISPVIMIIPRRILARAGSGNRCFWEASCTKLNPPGDYQKD
jgi:hypothetical protein